MNDTQHKALSGASWFVCCCVFAIVAGIVRSALSSAGAAIMFVILRLCGMV